MSDALAQQRGRPRIWDIAFGTPVTALPDREFVDPACGTNGGPAGLPLGAFGEFQRCPVEAATGLHEVWFTYDDEDEYVYRAHGDPIGAALRAHNVVLGQPVILSFLIDDAGFVQGYRIVTDTRAEPDLRREAYSLSYSLQSKFGMENWVCTDLGRGEGERPIAGVFIKESCAQETPERIVSVESRLYYRPGQDALVNPYLTDINAFVSSARLEVLANQR